MEKNLKISVIIPVYNSQDTLIRCVESIVFGQFRDIEVILIDDKSKDNSWEICNQLSEKYESVKCFQNEVNRGVSATRNVGLQFVSGEYVLFVDSDDWVSNEYIALLLSAVNQYQDALIICGLHFINYVDDFRQDYLWDENGPQFISVENSHFFELVAKFHIQQLWNKIFTRDIIVKNHICFDESISMGEDFQFVLDYMKASSCKKCVIINKPLYYYTRRNEQSLMSQFGLSGLKLETERYHQLFLISGEETIQQYDEAISSIKYNHAYHLIKNKKISSKEKKRIIHEIYRNGQARSYIKRIKYQLAKEELMVIAKRSFSLITRMRGKIQRVSTRKGICREKKRLTLKETPTIISQNCIGGVFYNDMGMKFISPTINLFFKAADFVKFISDLKYYLSIEIKMTWDKEYPVGYLDDIAVFFMHYDNVSEAKDDWERRKARMDWDNIVVFCTDMEGFSKKEFDIWTKVKYPKVLFTANPDYICDDNTLLINKYKGRDSVPDLIPNREFYVSGKLVEYLNKLN